MLKTITHAHLIATVDGEKGQALARHAFAYKAALESGEGTSFQTAWTTYAMCCTPHEIVMHDFLEALYGDSEDGTDWLELLPNIVFWLLFRHGKSAADRESALKFLADACEDLIDCHLRESEGERSQDASLAA